MNDTAYRSMERAREDFLKSLPDSSAEGVNPTDNIRIAFEAGYCAGYVAGAVDVTKKETAAEEPT